MFLNKKLKKLPIIMGGGGVIFFKCNSSPIISFGVENDNKNITERDTNNKYPAFSLIELSIVLIIMGLLVAGITGGASLINNARLTSFKREADDYIKDVFTFYAKVGRLPGDLDNSGKIGYSSGRNPYFENDFATPYTMSNINVVSGPFIELYLHGISSFQPKSNAATGKGITGAVNRETIKTIVADHGGMPFSKIYKDFMIAHGAGNTGVNMVIDVFTTEQVNVENKQTVDIIRKTDVKFDDGIHNSGNITAQCNEGTKGYTTTTVDATMCNHVFFHFNVR